jgi:hypothetical protein
LIKEWLHSLCRHDHDHSAKIDKDDQHIKKQTEKAENAVRQADEQLLQSKIIQEESKAVGQTARRIRNENHFTSRIRQALEGR